MKKKKEIEAISKEISPRDLSDQIVTTEPRFYVYTFKSISNLGEPKSTQVFIYCCPEKSPAKLRMIYSTAKTSTAAQVNDLGFTLAERRIEITDATELTEQFLKEELFQRKSLSTNQLTGRNQFSTKQFEDGGGVVKAAKVNSVSAHPVYSMIGKDSKSPTSSSKKKIVMPPPGAYC